jgi:hypothetical protein
MNTHQTRYILNQMKTAKETESTGTDARKESQTGTTVRTILGSLAVCVGIGAAYMIYKPDQIPDDSVYGLQSPRLINNHSAVDGTISLSGKLFRDEPDRFITSQKELTATFYDCHKAADYSVASIEVALYNGQGANTELGQGVLPEDEVVNRHSAIRIDEQQFDCRSLSLHSAN